ncbi:MAG: TraB/GumN family protein [Woeseia sp.]|nr:TraB/GumN family protein [Woeseia sp.]MBT8095584.1 TraB/GumN family protein [Woeseia sp.]NNE61246.1 TraB/GumN family protein [Woeseia sp.]NNL53581.1 TraB/GumN family protein [Woeseia sp.]
MRRYLLTAIATLLFAGTAMAEEALRLPLWHIKGEHNDVYLLASVHLLRATDYPLPDGIYAAFDDAETVVMELDMDDLDPRDAARIVTELGVIQGDGNLAALLGNTEFARATRLANAIGVPLDTMAKSEPWLAAMSIEQILLARLGFDATLGLENHLLQRALEAGKPIEGLETLREQLEILDRLPLDAQRTLVMTTLEDGPDIEHEMNELIDAWQRGDMRTMENIALEDMQEQPTLYREIVVERNRNWTGQIVNLLRHHDDYLVVVGALHLIGDDGVPAMLHEKGFEALQMDRQLSP